MSWAIAGICPFIRPAKVHNKRRFRMEKEITKDGYKWVIWSDGSGHLEDPHGHRVASFNKETSEIKLREWEHFDGTFAEMQAYILSKAPVF